MLWLTQVGFHSQLSLTRFLSLSHLLSFLKNQKNCNVTNFWIISNLFHHNYDDENFSKDNCETSFGNNDPYTRNSKMSFPWIELYITNRIKKQAFCENKLSKNIVSYFLPFLWLFQIYLCYFLFSIAFLPKTVVF